MSGVSRRPTGRSEPERRERVRADEMAEEKKLPLGAWLLVLNGKHKGEDFRLREGKNSVGSDPECQVHLTDPHVSARHAVITIQRTGATGGTYQVVDLDSTNGTFHNDLKEAISRAELVDNDTITFGQTRCKFKCT